MKDIAAALARDLDGAFEQFVVAYRDRVYGLALNLTGSRASADDVAQDVFVAAYRALRRYPPARRRALALRSWLYTIALNRVRNLVRATRPSASLDGVAESLRADHRDEPGAHVERRESTAELRAALARLPLRYRGPVVLRHIEERSYAEIAVILGQPVGTVKANVHRGLAQLRGMYQERNHHATRVATNAR